MSKFAVIVESPTKVKTINKILGKDFKVMASMGHLIDLPKSKLGVNIENGFAPQFIVVRSKAKILSKLKKDTQSAQKIYFATDPDREGEAIGWNLKEQIGQDKEIFRVSFQEITKDAVLKAFQHPRQFDQNLISAQVARRVLDRLVGYKISPFLWKKVGSRLSAGRVQSVALRIIVERERAIQDFNPKEYWQIAADLKKYGYEDILTANLDKISGEKFELGSKQATDELLEKIRQSEFVVTDMNTRTVRKKASPPLITSTLQQEAFNKLKFNANKTMMIAQQLYEGVDIGGETVGLITYMRTDSVNLSVEAVDKVREFITSKYGQKYLPDEPQKYKSKKSAQEAHEAIRPTDVARMPQEMGQFLDKDQLRLYSLIWERFVSCQMVPAEYEVKRMEITAGECLFASAGSTLVFDGYLAVDPQSREEEQKVDFSHYEKGDRLNLVELKPTQHFTKPPPRFSDASLVKALEEAGIGRPSTYAAIIQTLVFRNYVHREKGYFSLTDLGMTVSDLLVESFSKVMDIGFTAQMEEELDQVEEGSLTYEKLLKDFYDPLRKELEVADETVERTQNFVDQYCPDCGKQLVVKWGRRGRFLSCSGFPDCKFAKPFTTGVKCPNEGCDGELVQRQSRKGTFYGCSRYPKCTYVANQLPE